MFPFDDVIMLNLSCVMEFIETLHSDGMIRVFQDFIVTPQNSRPILFYHANPTEHRLVPINATLLAKSMYKKVLVLKRASIDSSLTWLIEWNMKDMPLIYDGSIKAVLENHWKVKIPFGMSSSIIDSLTWWYNPMSIHSVSLPLWKHIILFELLCLLCYGHEESPVFILGRECH